MSRSTTLRLRRGRYALGTKLGFFGYRIGSFGHALQRVIRPIRDLTMLATACGIALVYLVAFFGATAIDGTGAAMWALSATAATWICLGLVMFIQDQTRFAPGSPPVAGVRKPRNPSPISDTDGLKIEPTGRTDPTQ